MEPYLILQWLQAERREAPAAPPHLDEVRTLQVQPPGCPYPMTDTEGGDLHVLDSLGQTLHDHKST